jgi:DNA repair exonuclease SbcCD nuclease subunit
VFKFIHASDLHLGAPFEGIRVESPEVARTLADSTYEALDAIVRLAIDEGAAFVLLAGDVCNRADGNLRAHLALRKAARNLQEAGIALLIVYGNHDYLAPGRPDLDWPENCTVFGPETEAPVILKADGASSGSATDVAAVFGLSYGRRDETENLALRYPKPPDALFSIGLLHTACGPTSEHASYAPCTVQDLNQRGYDYWALGHIHRHAVLQSAGPTIAYSGNPQGLHPNEQGPRGCLLVTVGDRGDVSLEFRETDAVRWHIVEVDIGPLARHQDLLDALEASLKAHAREGKTSLVRFRLVGRGPLHSSLREPRMLPDLSDHLREAGMAMPGRVWTESIQVSTAPDLDLAARRESEDLLGDFLRIAEGLRASDDEVAKLVEMLSAPLNGSSGQPLRDIGMSARTLTPERVREWLLQAEWMGADRLIRGEE